MIRPSPGGFDYTDHEFKIMKLDILMAKTAGAKGVVFGILDKRLKIDIKRNLELVKLAKSKGL